MSHILGAFTSRPPKQRVTHFRREPLACKPQSTTVFRTWGFPLLNLERSMWLTDKLKL